jgi:phosphatidylglycerol:prolipoprotein diacylglycerol transferase
MFPAIFQTTLFGSPFVIGSYGIMLGIGFYSAFRVLEREVVIDKKNPDLAFYILLAAVLLGLLGAKLFYIFENFAQFSAAPIEILFSRSGLVVYGGLLLALAGCALIIRLYKYSVIEVFDLSAPAIATGFAFGRIGCHISGDGCHGIRSASFLALPYPNGIIPTLETVHPTSLFESFFFFKIAGTHLILRRDNHSKGWIFSLFLILTGTTRFLIEFIRLNPDLIAGLTQAQLIAAAMVTAGVAGLITTRFRPKRLA